MEKWVSIIFAGRLRKWKTKITIRFINIEEIRDNHSAKESGRFECLM